MSFSLALGAAIISEIGVTLTPIFSVETHQDVPIESSVKTLAVNNSDIRSLP